MTSANLRVIELENARRCVRGGKYMQGWGKFCLVWKHSCEARVVTLRDLPFGRARCNFVATDLEEDIVECHGILLMRLQLKVVDSQMFEYCNFQACSAKIGSAPAVQSTTFRFKAINFDFSKNTFDGSHFFNRNKLKTFTVEASYHCATISCCRYQSCSTIAQRAL